MRKPDGTTNQVSIRAYRLQDGALLWERKRRAEGPTFHAYAEGLIVYANRNPHRLVVLDATTGAFKYTVDLPGINNLSLPTVERDPVTGNVVAYLLGDKQILAVQLGETSGSILWQQQHLALNFLAVPTIVGDSVVVGTGGHYFAFDRRTGEMNLFHTSNLYGGGDTPVYDAQRSQIYIIDNYGDEATLSLAAYRYDSQQNVQEAWRLEYLYPDVDFGRSLALDSDGFIYTLGISKLLKIDPTDGTIVDSYEAWFSNGSVLVAGDYVFTRSALGTLVFDRNTLDLVADIPTGWGSTRSSLHSLGGVVDGYAVLRIRDTSTFTVGTGVFIPEPGTLLLVGVLLGAAAPRVARRAT